VSWPLAVACSFAARGIHSVLLPWLLVASLEASAREMSAVQAGAMLAQALALTLLGGLGDRLGPRRVAVAGQLAAALPPLALCLAGPPASPLAVAAYALCAGGLWGILCPPRDALVARRASRDLLRPATGYTVAQFAGLLAGIGVAASVGLVGATPLLGAVAALQAAAALATARVREVTPEAVEDRRSPAPPAAPASPPPPHEAARAQRELIALTVLLGLGSAGPFAVWVPLLASAHSAAPAHAIALLQALFPLGAIVGSLWLRRRERRLDLRTAVLAAHAAGSLCIAGAGLAGSFAWVLCGVAGWGLCGAVFISCGRALLLETAAPAQRTRALARLQLALLVSSPAGALLAGLGAGAADAHTSMRALGVASLCGALGVALASRRRALALGSPAEPQRAIRARPL
jgi:MFS family permease